MTRRGTLLAAVLLLALGGSALATYALWGKQIDVPVGVVTAGNLDLELVGGPVWAETSPDVESPGAIGMLDGVTAAHRATPGDTFTLTQDFRTVLEGDNMAARLTVDWDEAPLLAPAGRVTATYTITPPGGAPSASLALGDQLVLPPHPDNLTPAEVAAWGPAATWRLTVTLAYAGADVLVTPTELAAGPAPVTELGTIALRLDQVRDGDGFDS